MNQMECNAKLAAAKPEKQPIPRKLEHTQQRSGTKIQTRTGGNREKGCARKGARTSPATTEPARWRWDRRNLRHAREGGETVQTGPRSNQEPKRGVEKGGAFGGGTYRHRGSECRRRRRFEAARGRV
jgi:hypothetical protein